MHHKITLLIISIYLSILPLRVAAQESKDIEQNVVNFQEQSKVILKEQGSIKTKNSEEKRYSVVVVEVIEQKVTNNESGGVTTLQNLKLRGLNGDYKDKELVFLGLDNNITTKDVYKKGDKLFVRVGIDSGLEIVFVEDKIRTTALSWLMVLFVGTVLYIARGHGFKSLLSLFLTFIIIIKWVVPAISKGSNPLLITLCASCVILPLSIVLVYGWKRKSGIAILGTFLGVFITVLLSLISIRLSGLTGFSAEESLYLLEIFQHEVDLRGLLLAGFILGSLGVLDDIAVTQVSTVEEIWRANTSVSQSNLYRSAMRVGIDHISSMINTLFLAYAGASFFLLFLFNVKQSPFENISSVVNNEIVATEIVRVLVGSIGLILSVPLTTYIASRLYRNCVNTECSQPHS